MASLLASKRLHEKGGKGTPTYNSLKLQKKTFLKIMKQSVYETEGQTSCYSSIIILLYWGETIGILSLVYTALKGSIS